MISKSNLTKGLLSLPVIAALAFALRLAAQDKPAAATPDAAKPAPMATIPKAPGNFDAIADKALAAMLKRFGELPNMKKGVALVAYAEGDEVKSWTSKMMVVNTMKDPPAGSNKGNNLLGIAYTKASEMADTLKDSGSKVRPPMTGEYGYQGGAVAKGKTGVLIASFSGGASQDDYQVSKAGLAVLVESGL